MSAIIDGTSASSLSGTLTVTGATTLSSTLAVTGAVTLTTALGVASGGTGATTFTDAGVLIGNATGAVQVTTAGTSGQVLTSNGAGVDPTFQTLATSPFTAKSTSADTALPANGATATIAHGLGSAPFNFDVFLKNATAELGWSIGDTIKIGLDPHSATSDRGCVAYSDATNVYFLVAASGMNMYNKSTGAAATITLGNWRIVVKAWV